VRAKTAGDALSDDEDEAVDSEDEAGDVGGAFGRSNRRKRQGGVSSRTGKISMGSSNARTTARQRGKQTIVSGYSNSLVDANARLGAGSNGSSGPRKKRSFFTTSHLPPIMPLGVNIQNGVNGAEEWSAQVNSQRQGIRYQGIGGRENRGIQFTVQNREPNERCLGGGCEGIVSGSDRG
jgi:hypothetical protein